VDRIADHIPLQQIEVGPEKGKVLVLGWGSTFGAIKSAVLELLAEGHEVAHAHLRYLRPFPKNLAEILHSYDHVLIPEINNGQLIRIIRDEFLIPAQGYNKIMGVPITKGELVARIRELL
jgi:2-oxoglutarate ferredoxin oxidoreductase subunit alpha